jgi:hypothetical protein
MKKDEQFVTVSDKQGSHLKGERSKLVSDKRTLIPMEG